MMHRQQIGWQIVHVETDDPPPHMDTYEIYPIDFVVRWFAGLSNDQKPLWRCLPVFEGDVEEPRFCFSWGHTASDEQVAFMLPKGKEGK